MLLQTGTTVLKSQDLLQNAHAVGCCSLIKIANMLVFTICSIIQPLQISQPQTSSIKDLLVQPNTVHAAKLIGMCCAL